MIRINLRPDASGKTMGMRTAVTMALVVSAYVTAAWLHLEFSGEIDSLETKLGSVKREAAGYQKAAKEAVTVEKEGKILLEKLKTMERFRRLHSMPQKLLEAVSESVVSGRMWLTGIAVVKSELTVSGMALDGKTASDFTLRLGLRDLFAKVRLKSIKGTACSENVELKSFVAACRLREIVPLAHKDSRP